MTGRVSGPGEKGRAVPFTFMLILLLLAFFVWRSGTLGPPEVVPLEKLIVPVPVVSENTAPREGYYSPDFEARTRDGEAVRLSDMRGKAVFLNFWAPWCGPCRAEMAAIGRLAESAPADIRILTIAIDSNGEDVARFADKHDVRFPIIHDKDGSLGATFQIAGIPTTILLDPRGLVVSRIVGPRAWDHPDFLAWISKLAGGPRE
ncbi:MAG: TlpA family protein disulfide reductase [Myxococcota bacterium]